MQLALLYIAIVLVVVKLVATVWYVRQPDAVAVTATMRGRLLYYAGKVSPALFVACLLLRACLRHDTGRVMLWSALLALAVVAAAIAIRQRATGRSYGLVHDMKRRRRGRDDSSR